MDGSDCSQSEEDQLEAHSCLDPEDKLLQTVRSCLEHKHYLRKVRSEMRQKVLETIQGPVEPGESLFRGNSGTGRGQPPRAVQLINQMILEYFEWYNLQYSAEMFSAESGTARLERAIQRQKLQNSLKSTLEDPLEFQPDLPILAELVMKLAASAAVAAGGSAD